MKEKIYTKRKIGLPMLFVVLIVFAGTVAGLIASISEFSYAEDNGLDANPVYIVLFIVCITLFIFNCILCSGFKMLNPNEALVLTLFGKYKGTLKEAGFYFVNNNKQKINDCLGNPVEIGIAVIWKVVDTAKAVFDVDNYMEFLSLQCDAALREIVRNYPYDVAQNVDTTGDGVADEGSLRGSSEVVAGRIKDEIQKRVAQAGLEIAEARITYLAYAPEIAAAMLQRQQASAIVDARKLIVDGAVGMVQMALDSLSEKEIVDLDDERKAAMVSNLLVVLCGNHDAQPIVNSGSLY